jgi:hypothetical protein
MEKVIHKGKVSELKMKDKTYLALDMPHKPEDATISFALEAVLSIQEIFMPYLGKSVIITIEKEEGKVHKIIIEEGKMNG